MALIALFQNDAVLKHKFMKKVLCPGLDKSMFNHMGKRSLKPQCYGSDTETD